VGRGREGEGNGGGCGKLTSAAASNDTGDRSDLMAFGDSNGFQFGRQAVSLGGAWWARARPRAMATATGWDSEEGRARDQAQVRVRVQVQRSILSSLFSRCGREWSFWIWG
jgi:hypothetical protein